MSGGSLTEILNETLHPAQNSPQALPNARNMYSQETFLVTGTKNQAKRSDSVEISCSVLTWVFLVQGPSRKTKILLAFKNIVLQADRRLQSGLGNTMHGSRIRKSWADRVSTIAVRKTVGLCVLTSFGFLGPWPYCIWNIQGKHRRSWSKSEKGKRKRTGRGEVLDLVQWGCLPRPISLDFFCFWCKKINARLQEKHSHPWCVLLVGYRLWFYLRVVHLNCRFGPLSCENSETIIQDWDFTTRHPRSQ